MMLSSKGLFLFLCHLTGSAGLYCLSCTDVDSPRHCHTVRKCSDGEMCFTESHLSENGLTVFDIGCASAKFCHSKRSTRYNLTMYNGVDPHYDHRMCRDCCSNDICNNQGCGQPGYPDDRGPVCFNCPVISHPTLCDKIKVCETNQECHIHENSEFGDVYYTSSCISKHACPSSLPAFGKRYTQLCYNCCHTDMCNDKCGTSSATSPTTTSTPSTTIAPSQKSIQGKEFLLLFMRNFILALESEKAYIITNEDVFFTKVALNITSSSLLENSIKSKVDRNTFFSSNTSVIFPNNLTCHYQRQEYKALLISTSMISSVVIFDSHDFATNDGTSIIPTHKLSTRYLVSSVDPGQNDNSQFAIASLQDGNLIRITLKMKNRGNITISGKLFYSGDTYIRTFDKFETFQIGHNSDLSGTLITSEKPIAVFSGNRCKAFPSSTCSHMFSQLPPVQEYDNEYIIPFFYKNTRTLVQVLSFVRNNVTITVGQNVSTLHFGAQDYQNFEFPSNVTSIVKSEHPVQVLGFAMGSYTNDIDPYMTVIPGIRHYLNYYRIIVPENYKENFICVIIPYQSLEYFRIDHLPVNSFSAEFQRWAISSGKIYAIRILSVNPGVHVLKTTDHAAFGLLVYGHRYHDGYGYAGNFVFP